MLREQENAVIVQIRGRHAAALSERGEFIKIRNERYEIGQSVVLEQPQKAARSTRRRARLTAYAGMAAGFLLLLLGGFKGYTMPAGVVSLDVNPSIEYTINCFDRVLTISAVNDDARVILETMDTRALRYRSVDEAVDATILALREGGYFTGAAENDVVISASSYGAGHTEEIANRLGERAKRQSDLTVYSIAVSRGEVKDAHALGTSAGKLRMIEQLGESWNEAGEFDPEAWIAQPVRVIIRETRKQRDGEYITEEEDNRQSEAKPGASAGSDQKEQNRQGEQNRKEDASGNEKGSSASPRQDGQKPEKRDP